MVRFVCVLRVSYSPGRSVAVADVPGSPLSIGGFDASTDTITASGLCLERCHVGCHSPLNGRVGSGGVVEKEHSVVCFDHESIIQGHQT